MTEAPFISVVVPFFDSERHLAPCIDSLLAQRSFGEAYEIILINNASTDGSAAIAHRYRDELTLLEESAPGAYAARNTGIRAARGPLIALTDADCVVDPDWLRSIFEGMSDPKTAILLGHCQYATTSSPALRLLAAYENAKAEYVTSHCDPTYRFAYANNMAVRASVFAELGPFEEWPRAADTELVHRLTARRPDLEVVYRPSMRVTHLEFSSGMGRARRLRLYRRTNTRIATFRELGLAQHARIVARLIRSSARRREDSSPDAAGR